MQKIKGQITIAHQYRFPSFGIGLLHRMKTGTPCAVYVDDDDIALTMPGRSNPLHRRLRTPTGDIPTRVMHRLRERADVTFCGSSYYSKKYGGINVPLGRDPDEYSPNRFDRLEIRHKHKISDNDVVVGFVGNPRKHVGFEDLIGALEIINNENCLLLIVPSGELNESSQELLRNSRIRFRIIEAQDSRLVPEFLAASDLVVVPQRSNPISEGQISARLVDAMAMQKPIVSTRTSDNEDLLLAGAIFANEHDPQDLSEKIQYLLDNPQDSAKRARIARQRFMEKLSLDAMRQKLLPELERLLANKPR
jgi:glycosyltransferase involved in cell wall biosynthesis